MPPELGKSPAEDLSLLVQKEQEQFSPFVENKYQGVPSATNENEDMFEQEFIESMDARDLQEIETSLEQKSGLELEQADFTTSAAFGKEVLDKLQPEPGKEKTISGKAVQQISDIPSGLASGVINAGVEFVETFDDLQSFLRSQLSEEDAGEFEIFPDEKFKEIFSPQTVTGTIAKGIAQFLTGFIPIFKASQSIKFGAGAIKGGGMLARAAISGGLADMVVWNPEDPNISSLLASLPAPARNPITEFLETDMDAADFENRLRNATEGLVAGSMIDGLLVVGRLMKSAKKAKELLTPQEVEEAQRILKESEVAAPKRAEAGEPGALDLIEKETEKVIPSQRFTPGPQVKGVSPEKMAEFLDASPDSELFKNPGRNDKQTRETLGKIANAFKEDIEKRKRGKLTHKDRERLAKELIERGDITIDKVLSLKPGTVLNAEEIEAAGILLEAIEPAFRASMKLAKQGGKAEEDEFMRMLDIQARLGIVVSGVQSELGRALGSLARNNEGNVVFFKQSQRGEIIESVDSDTPVKMLINKLEALPEKQKRTFRQRLFGKEGLAAIQEIWINGLLSNTTTPMINFTSTLAFSLLAPAERALAARIGFGTSERVVVGEAKALLYGQIMSTVDAARLFVKVMKTGEGTSEFTKVEGLLTPKMTGKAFGVGGVPGVMMDWVGKVARTPGRLLQATDEALKLGNYRGELNALAIRRASEEGKIPGSKAFGERVAGIVSDPPSDMVKASSDFSHYATFTRPLTGPGKKVQEFVSESPGFRFLLPFTRTPINLTMVSMERMPGLNLFIKESRQNMLKGGAKGQLARARLMMGSGFMGTIVMMARAGYITGDGPKNPILRQQWIDSGWQPNSMWLGRWVSFDRGDPFAALMGMAADYAAIASDLGPEEGDTMAMALISSFAKNVISKTYLMSASLALNAIVQGSERGAGATFIRSFERSLIPSGVRQITRAIDPAQREAETYLENLQRGIPGWSEDLPPKRDVFGDVDLDPLINAMTPWKIRDPKDDLVFNELNRLRLGLGNPPRVIGTTEKVLEADLEPVGVKLTLEQWDRWLVLAGNGFKVRASAVGVPGGGEVGFKDTLARLFLTKKYLELTDEIKKSFIKRIQGKFRFGAKMALFKEFPQVKEDVFIFEAQKEERRVGRENLPKNIQNLLGVGQ